MVGQKGDWYQIGADRWVHSDYIKKGGAGANAGFKKFTVTVTPDIGLNVRSGPGTQYKIVKAVTKGTKLTVIGKSGAWYKVGNNQYVYSKYVR